MDRVVKQLEDLDRQKDVEDYQAVWERKFDIKKDFQDDFGDDEFALLHENELKDCDELIEMFEVLPECVRQFNAELPPDDEIQGSSSMYVQKDDFIAIQTAHNLFNSEKEGPRKRAFERIWKQLIHQDDDQFLEMPIESLPRTDLPTPKPAPVRRRPRVADNSEFE